MNGNGKIESLLERIADRLDVMDERQEAQGKELAMLRRDVNIGFAAVNQRIDNALAIGGGRYLDDEQRIQVLEERVLGKSG